MPEGSESKVARIYDNVGSVLLAGGLARRMGGQDKGLILLCGRPMASYALDVLVPRVADCIINANRNSEAYSRLQGGDVRVVADIHKGHLGPLAGLSAAIANLKTQYVLMCPCDSPFLQGELVDALIHECISADADIAVAHDGERLQPVFCIVNRRVNSSLNAFLDSGERKIDRWFLQHKTLEVAAQAFKDSFRNINTEEERLAAEQDLLP